LLSALRRCFFAPQLFSPAHSQNLAPPPPPDLVHVGHLVVA
jgi:hypothetical protein